MENINFDDYYGISNIILNNGKTIIGCLVAYDEHTIVLEFPIEIKKRCVSSNNSITEVITVSPFLVLTDSPRCTIPNSQIMCKNELIENFYDSYLNMIEKYYIDAKTDDSSIYQSLPKDKLH